MNGTDKHLQSIMLVSQQVRCGSDYKNKRQHMTASAAHMILSCIRKVMLLNRSLFRASGRMGTQRINKLNKHVGFTPLCTGHVARSSA